MSQDKALIAGWLERDGKYAGYYTRDPDGNHCYHFSASSIEGECCECGAAPVAEQAGGPS